MVMVCRYCWCWGGGWLGMQWGCRGGLGKSSTWRHQGSFPCTCALGTQNPTTHDVVDEIRPRKTHHHSRCTWEPRRGGQNFASTLGPHVWSSRRPTLPRTEIPPRQPPNARKKKSEHRERHRHPHDTAAVSSKSRNFFWGLQNLRKSRKRSEGSLRHCSCVKQRRCQLRPQQMPHRQ